MGSTELAWHCRVRAASSREGSQSCSHLGASSSGSSDFPLSPECKSHRAPSMEALLRFSTLSDTPTSQALTSHCFPFSYEDPAALDGGEKGMDIITHILALAPRLLKDSGSIFLEVDPRHPELVGGWLQSRPDLSLDLVAVRKDFCGRPRFLHIRRSGPPHGCPAHAWPGPQPARVPG